MLYDVAASRIVAATSATITFTGRDSDGEPADPGVVTVGVVRSSGAQVVAPGTATVTDGNARTYTLSAAMTADVDRLTATWSSAGVTLATTTHDVVGDVYATSTEIRADGDGLGDVVAHPPAELIAVRTEVEYQIESACNRAFVPRFASEIIDHRGGNVIVLRYPELRSIVWADHWTGDAWAPAEVDVSTVDSDDSGLAVLPATSWPCGRVRIGYRYGKNRPDPIVRREAIKAISYAIHADNSGIDPRATSFTSDETGTLRLATPGIGIWITAIPTVDTMIRDNKWHPPVIG